MKAILLDFDGVVIRSMEDHFEGWKKALEEYDIIMSPEELFVLEGSGLEDLAHQFTRKYNLPFDEAPNIIRKKCDYYNQIKKIEFYPYLMELLNWVREREMRLGLVTGGGRDRVISTLDTLGFSDLFDVIITCDDVFTTKPSPEPYLKAAGILEIDPEDCVVIENAPLGIRSAKAAGMRCIAVTTTLSPMYLKEADIVSEDLDEALNALKRMY